MAIVEGGERSGGMKEGERSGGMNFFQKKKDRHRHHVGDVSLVSNLALKFMLLSELKSNNDESSEKLKYEVWSEKISSVCKPFFIKMAWLELYSLFIILTLYYLRI